MPGTSESGVNSLDGNIHVIINKNLSVQGRAESYSHEANGHALIYVNTRDRDQSKHKGISTVNGFRETNNLLINAIKSSKMETVKNMKAR